VAGVLLTAALASASSATTIVPAPGRPGIEPFQEDRSLHPAPVDYGYGPGVSPGGYRAALRTALRAIGGEPVVGGPDAVAIGAFGPPVTWPVLGVHAVLLPDGRVLSYGPRWATPVQPALVYDIWDPALGTGEDSHLVLPNTTGTEIFCSAQSVIATSGEVLLAGGDRTVGDTRNYSHRLTAMFKPATNRMRASSAMTYRRWYPTLVGTADGSLLVVGGREDQGPIDPTTVPELFRPGKGWRVLSGANSDAAFGRTSYNWSYPRAFVAPGGKVFVLAHSGAMFLLDTAGSGAIRKLATSTSAAAYVLPAVMYAPGRILSLRNARRVVNVSLTATGATVAATASIDQVRYHANATVLADGRVLVNGGSSGWNKLEGAAYAAQIWDPATGAWTTAAVAQKPRLYHSTSLLLPDATVLTVGGGEPGPVVELNAEIYHPPYLFARDGSGTLAPRPVLVAAPTSARVGQTLAVTVGPEDRIGRVTLVRTGSATHDFNADQRFAEAAFTQAGAELTVTLPAGAATTPPGYYMLFAFGADGVPSQARMIRLLA
jgi:hypothetical protein